MKSKPLGQQLERVDNLRSGIAVLVVVWCQFALLALDLSAFTKFLATFLVAFSLSWLMAHAMRKIRPIGRYL